MKVIITLDDNLNVAMETSRQMTFTEIQRLINALLNMYELFSQYPASQKGVARDPKPDEMKLQQGRKSPTRKPLAADHPASSHKKKRSFYWTKERHEILTDNFFKKTPEEIMKLLPGVTLEEIQQHAEYSGLVLKKPGDKNEGTS